MHRLLLHHIDPRPDHVAVLALTLDVEHDRPRLPSEPEALLHTCDVVVILRPGQWAVGLLVWIDRQRVEEVLAFGQRARLRVPFREGAVQIVGDPVLFELVFTGETVTNYRHTLNSDKAAEARYNQLMRERGILKPPGKIYTHLALTAEDLDRIADAFRDTAEIMAAEA